jgi:hypothetical protein
MTAAGFPANRRVVNASIWNIGVRMELVLREGDARSTAGNLFVPTAAAPIDRVLHVATIGVLT